MKLIECTLFSSQLTISIMVLHIKKRHWLAKLSNARIVVPALLNSMV